MSEVLFALLAIVAGLSLLFFGYKLARFIIPFWGFFAGFSIGSAVFADAKNTAFIGTTMGVVSGIIVGLVFALIAYFFYSLAVVLLGANLGYIIGTGVLGLFGIDKGFLSATIGIIAGIVFAILTIQLNIAKYLLITLTALAGTITLLIGALILFGKADPNLLDYVSTHQTLEGGWLWTIVFWLLLIIGITVQTISTKKYTIDDWTTGQGGPKSTKTYKNS